MHFTRLKESDEYRRQREQLRAVEMDLIDHVERVAALRRTMPSDTVVDDYELVEVSTGDPVRLSSLFSTPDRALVIYHLMYGKTQQLPCPLCTMWIDGYNAAALGVFTADSLTSEQLEKLAKIIVAYIRKAPDKALSRGQYEQRKRENLSKDQICHILYEALVNLRTNKTPAWHEQSVRDAKLAESIYRRRFRPNEQPRQPRPRPTPPAEDSHLGMVHQGENSGRRLTSPRHMV